jgi:protein-disulfide isomerase
VRSHRHLDQVGPLTNSRSGLVYLAAALLVFTSGAQDEDPLAARSKGAANAPVTVYEMADFQCPACRLFTVTVLPTLEREFVQTGKVRWVFINLPLTSIHPNAFFWQTHDALYQQQDDWAKLPQPRAKLVVIAQRAGVDRAKLLACLDAGEARKEVEADAQRALRSGARATPSFYIEGGLLQGAPYTPDPMRQVLDSIYAARTSKSK